MPSLENWGGGLKTCTCIRGLDTGAGAAMATPSTKIICVRLIFRLVGVTEIIGYFCVSVTHYGSFKCLELRNNYFTIKMCTCTCLYQDQLLHVQMYMYENTLAIRGSKYMYTATSYMYM